MLESRFAIGTRHPAALGTPGAEIFPEVWDDRPRGAAAEA